MAAKSVLSPPGIVKSNNNIYKLDSNEFIAQI